MCFSAANLDLTYEWIQEISLFWFIKNIIPENSQIMHSHSEILSMSSAYFISEHYGWYIKTSASMTWKFYDSSKLKKLEQKQRLFVLFHSKTQVSHRTTFANGIAFNLQTFQDFKCQTLHSFYWTSFLADWLVEVRRFPLQTYHMNILLFSLSPNLLSSGFTPPPQIVNTLRTDETKARFPLHFHAFSSKI